jgi:hypothetical protein
MSQGYFFIANGVAYCERMKKYLIPSIRLFDKIRPIVVLTDTPSAFEKTNVKVLESTPAEWLLSNKLPTTAEFASDFFTKGTLPKLMMYALSPFEHTLFLDEDIVCLKDINLFWNECLTQSSQLLCAGESDLFNKGPSSWHWGKLDNVIEKCGFPIPQVNSGTVYWRKSNLMLPLLLEYLRDPKEYNIRGAFRGTYPDEIFLAIYMGLMKIRPIPFKSNHEVYDTFERSADCYFVQIFSKNASVMEAYLERACSTVASKQSLAGFYQCHKNPKNFLECMKSFRYYYPDSNVVVVSDGGHNYETYCKRQKCDYTYVPKDSNMAAPLIYSSRDAALGYLRRLWNAFPKMTETHFILLEDDVRVLKRHTAPFQYSINGCNQYMFLPSVMATKLCDKGYTGPTFYGGCGGCILDKEFYMSIPFEAVQKLLEETPLTEFPADQLFSFIALYFGGSIGPYNEFTETLYPDWAKRVAKNEIAFLHQYKKEYGMEPTTLEKAILGIE